MAADTILLARLEALQLMLTALLADPEAFERFQIVRRQWLEDFADVKSDPNLASFYGTVAETLSVVASSAVGAGAPPSNFM
jgi:hypothetical protein